MKKILTVMMTLCMALLIAGCGEKTPKFEGFYKIEEKPPGWHEIIEIQNNNNIYKVIEHKLLYASNKDGSIATDKFVYEKKFWMNAIFDDKKIRLKDEDPFSTLNIFYKDGKYIFDYGGYVKELIPLTKEELEKFKAGEGIRVKE